MPIIHEVSHRVRIDAAMLRELAKAPESADVAYIGGEIVCVWSEPAGEAVPAEKPIKAPKAKKEDAPSAPPAPVDVDWAASLRDAKPTAADLKRAEEEIGAVRVAEVRARLSIGAGVTVVQIAMQSNAKEYFDALRAVLA